MMNQIYKVVWSRAKHCYVVASELAKGVTKGASPTKTFRRFAVGLSIAALLAGGGLTGYAAATDVAKADGTGNISVYETTDVCTKTEIDTALGNKANSADVYTKTETDAALANKADSSDVYTKTEVDAALGNKANSADVYSKTDADSTFATKTELTTEQNAREAADTAINNKIGTGQDGNYTTADGTISANIKALDDQAKLNATAISNEEVARKEADVGNVKIDADGNLSKVGADGTSTTAVSDIKVTGEISGLKLSVTNGLSAAGNKFTVSETDGSVNTSGDIGGKDITASGTLSGNSVSAGSAAITNGLTAGSATITNDLSAANITSTGKLEGNSLNVTHNAEIGGTLSVTGNTTLTGKLNANGGVDAGSSTITTTGTVHGGTVTADTLTAGTATVTGTLNAAGGIDAGNSEIKTSGNITGGAIKGSSLESTGNTTVGGNLAVTGTSTFTGKVTTTGDLDVGGKLTTAEFSSDKITSGTDTDNQTVIEKGNVTSKNSGTDGGVQKSSESTFNLDGSSIIVRQDEGAKDTTGESSVTATSIKQSLRNNATAAGATKSADREITGNSDDGYKISDTIKDNAKSNTLTSDVDQSERVVTDGTNNSTFQQRVDAIRQELRNGTKLISTTQDTNGIVSKTEDGDNKTAITQGIDGTYKIETSGASTEEIGGLKTENYNGGLETKVTGDESHEVTGNQTNIIGGNQTTTVTGDSRLTAENINNTAKNKITNSAIDIENTVSSSIKDTVQNDNGTNITTKTSTQTQQQVVNHVTGQNAAYKTGADEEKTVLVDGDKKTTISNVAGTISSQVTNGTNTITEVADSDAGAKAVTVTDGTNTSSHVQTATAIANAATNITNAASETLANSAKNITNTATEGITNSAADIANVASNSISDKVGTNVSRDMTTMKITEEVTDGADKVNKETRTANKYLNKVTDGSAASSISQNADKIDFDLKDGDTYQKQSNSIADGTVFENSNAKDPISENGKNGSKVNTTIKGNTIETGKATMDFAEVLQDLGVRGDAKIDGKTDTGSLEVQGESNLKGNTTIGTDSSNTLNVKATSNFDAKATFNKGAEVKEGLTVTDGTTTDTLNVTGTSEFGGTATFKDIVTMEKDLNVGGNATVTGDVTANSYKIGDKTYIDANGLNANNLKISNVAAGELSANSMDAVNGSQLYATNQEVDRAHTRIDGVERRVDKLDGRLDKVGASAAAMANLHPLEFDGDSKWNIAAAVGNYRSETATAVGAFYRPNENTMVNLSTSFGTGENMVGGGVSVRLGSGGNKKRARAAKAVEEENRQLRARLDDLTARMDALLSVINPAMSKEFPDVPQNHWAYEAVSRLAGNGIVEGYEDGEYHGDRTMSRYEMAEIIYNALSKGAEAEKKLVDEFKPELQAMAAHKQAGARE